MKKEVNAKESTRAQAFEMWMKSPMPMVSFTKTFNITRLLKASKKSGMKSNMILCWCIGKAASQVEEFYSLPIDGKLWHFDSLGIQVIVMAKNGVLKFCDVPFSEDIRQFADDYERLTRQTIETCQHHFIEDRMIVGTSAMVQTELDSVANQYNGSYNNPFLAWSRYRKHWFKVTLPISMQFHHVQMDGGHAARFLQILQDEIEKL